MIGVQHLLDRFVDTLGSFSVDDDEREMFDAVVDSLTPGELLDIVTANSIELIRAQVASSRPLVLSLN